jgi:hypothetical protein
VNALIDDDKPCLRHVLLYRSGVLSCRLCGTQWDEAGQVES